MTVLQSQSAVYTNILKNDPTIQIKKKQPTQPTATIIQSQPPTTTTNSEMATPKRDDYYQKLLKFEQKYNSGQTALINNMQDPEMKEIIAYAESYMNLCLTSIKETDSLFNVLVKCNNEKQTQKQVNPTKRMEFPTLTKPKLPNDIINISAVLPYDFIRYGLKSTPINQIELVPTPQKPTKNFDVNASQQFLSESSRNFSLPPLKQAMKNIQNPADSKLNAQQLTTKNVITLKYLLVLDLNSNYFTFMKPNEDNSVFKIKISRKPQAWSINDYELVTVVVDPKPSKTPSNVNYPTPKDLFSKSTNSFLQTSMTSLNTTSNVPESKKNRFINSKTLIDRIYKHFSRTIKTWPTLDQAFSTGGNKYSIYNDSSKTCTLAGNQIKVAFKWKGIKFKAINVNLVINVAIKFYDQGLEHKVLESIKVIANNFLKTGGLQSPLPPLYDINPVFDNLVFFCESIYKLDIRTMYLSANSGVHYWSPNLLPIKLNLLKFLCSISSLTTSSPMLNGLISLLSKNPMDVVLQASYPVSNRLVPPKVVNHQAITNSSPLFVYIKTVQIVKYVGFNAVGIQDKLESEHQNEEELIANLAFHEINKCGSALYTGVMPWSQENIFQRIWTSCLDLRTFVLNFHMKDQFEIFNNVLPISWINYIGFYFVPLPLNTKNRFVSQSIELNKDIAHLSDIESVYYTTQQHKQREEILSAIEFGMKNLLTSVSPTETTNVYELEEQKDNVSDDDDDYDPTAIKNNPFPEIIKDFDKPFFTETVVVGSSNMSHHSVDLASNDGKNA